MATADPDPPARDAAAGWVRGSNQSGVRAHNERLVLSLLRQAGPMAKAQIARATGLSAQTVSVIMRGLEADGLLARGEPVRGRVGQPSVPMRLAPDGAYFYGLKVGRRSVEMVLADMSGRVVGRQQRTHRFPAPDATLAFARAALAQLADGLTPGARARVAGLGIAIPFSLWDWARALGEPAADMADWRHRDIAAELAAALEFPVFLQNDATSACAAELVFGRRPLPRDFLYFYFGFYIGGGLVLDGALFTGRSGNAAAMGPMPVPGPDGRLAQLIDLASLSVLERRLQAAGHATDSLWRQPEGWQADPAILDRWIDEAAAATAHAIRAAAALVEPEAAVIDGWLPAAVRDALVARTAAALQRLDFVGIDRPRVTAGSVGPDARALGAASLPLSRKFLVDQKAFLKPL